MSARDQFGNYLLLKKLTEDALGETFRAGKIGRQALERVVLLRVYNGQGLDSERVARTIQARAGLAQALKSPNIATAVDSGQVRGVPFVAYDYISGRTLGQLNEQAARRGQPMPLDHALLIAERMAAGLSVAFETRFGEDRLVHGMLTPHQVMVSHEGELRLSGFEAAPGTRAATAHPVVKQALGRYLAPEALAGQPPSKNDDVFSLGAMLFEMLTGQPAPALPASGLGPVIEQAVVAYDGGNLHPELAALLKRSLCPREARVGDVVAWHKSLAKLMADGQYNPTTFNLAFFLHNLFRDEIERETQELETERTQAIPISVQTAAPAPAPPAPVAAAAAPTPVRETGSVRENTDILREKYGIPEKKGGPNIALIAGGAAAVIVLAVAGWWFFGRGGGSTGGEAAPLATAAPETAAPAPAAPAGPTPEQIQAQIAQMIDEQSKELEAGLKARYEEQLKTLQKQLEDSKKTQAAPAPAPAPLAAAPIRPLDASPATSTSRPAPSTGAPAPATATPPPATAAPIPATVAPTTPAPAPSAPTPAAATASPAPAAPAPATERVKVGELVTAGAGVTPPRVLRKPALRYPPIAQRMRKEATVTVSVLVDENGRVQDTRRVGPAAGSGLDEAAADFARECSFAPATKDGVKVRMWYDLKVAFTLRGN